MTSTATISRYSDAELAEFKVKIDLKLSDAREEYVFIIEQIKEQTESIESDGDWMDNSSSANDLELMYIMANRQRKHIEDLEKALIRIKHKSYGICLLTGELIDKRRLIAVPTTTKSLAAKLGEIPNINSEPDEEEEVEKKKTSKRTEPLIFSRVIKKPSILIEEYEDDDEYDNMDEYDNEDEMNFVDDSANNTEAYDIVDPDSLEEE